MAQSAADSEAARRLEVRPRAQKDSQSQTIGVAAADGTKEISPPVTSVQRGEVISHTRHQSDEVTGNLKQSEAWRELVFSLEKNFRLTCKITDQVVGVDVTNELRLAKRCVISIFQRV